MSTTRSNARRPRRPAGARHDPDGVNELELLDETRLEAAHRRKTVPPVEPLVQVSGAVLLLTAGSDCGACGKRTPVHALAALPEFETEDAEARLLRRIAVLPPALDKAVRELTGGRMRPEHGLRASATTWVSHCRGCGATQPEARVLGAQGPFLPTTYAQRRAIKATRVAGPFALEDVRPVRCAELLEWLAWQRRLEDKRAAAKALEDVVRPRGRARQAAPSGARAGA